MKTGIVGLGLIGGSLAKAYKKNGGHTVYGLDINESIAGYAMLSKIIDKVLTRDNMSECDLILIAAYPDGAKAFLEEYAQYISKDTFVIDCLGTKSDICKLGFEKAKEYGFTFIGGHPMAGTHKSGIKYSKDDMFDGVPMVLVPPVFDDIRLIEKAEEYLKPCKFGMISITTAEKHDKLIAFTSQLAHIVSSAYIKSPTADFHQGFSAGSYKDMTRVAWLNPEMWAELFLENKENLVNEIDGIIKSLNEYKTAIENNDKANLIKLLDDGRKKKEEIDGM